MHDLQYPDAWGADASTDYWFDENIIGDRARLVHSIVRLPTFEAPTVVCQKIYGVL